MAPRRIGARLFDALRAGLADGLPGKTQALGRLRRAHRERCLLRGAKRVLRLPRAAPGGQSLLAALCGTSTGDAAALAEHPPSSLDGDGVDPPAAKRARAGPIPGAGGEGRSAPTRAPTTRRRKLPRRSPRSFPAALPNAAKALLRGPYNEAYVWFPRVRRRRHCLRRLGGLRSQDPEPPGDGRALCAEHDAGAVVVRGGITTTRRRRLGDAMGSSQVPSAGLAARGRHRSAARRARPQIARRARLETHRLYDDDGPDDAERSHGGHSVRPRHLAQRVPRRPHHGDRPGLPPALRSGPARLPGHRPQQGRAALRRGPAPPPRRRPPLQEY